MLYVRFLFAFCLFALPTYSSSFWFQFSFRFRVALNQAQKPFAMLRSGSSRARPGTWLKSQLRPTHMPQTVPDNVSSARSGGLWLQLELQLRLVALCQLWFLCSASPDICLSISAVAFRLFLFLFSLLFYVCFSCLVLVVVTLSNALSIADSLTYICSQPEVLYLSFIYLCISIYVCVRVCVCYVSPARRAFFTTRSCPQALGVRRSVSAVGWAPARDLLLAFMRGKRSNRSHTHTYTNTYTGIGTPMQAQRVVAM